MHAALRTSAETKAKLFRGLADPSRLSILESLRAGGLSVTEIVAKTGLSQPNASNHLACLLDCGLVTRHQQGRRAIYTLGGDLVEGVLSLSERLLAQVATGVASCGRYASGRGPGNRAVAARDA